MNKGRNSDMEDETLSNILNILQNSNNNTTNSSANANNNTNINHNNGNNDLQNLLLKMLLSGGLNNMFAPKPKEPEPETKPAPPRTINLENYKRLDWTTMAPLTTSTATKCTLCAIICSEILSSICVWIKRRNGLTPYSRS